MNVTINGYYITCTPEEFRALVQIPAAIHTPPVPVQQPPSSDPFRAKEIPNKRRRGNFVTLPQFVGLEDSRPKSSMFRLFQIVAASYPKPVLAQTACKSLGWSKVTTWEYSCALEDAGLIERKDESYIAKSPDISTAEAVITEFDYCRDPNNHHYLRVKDRVKIADRDLYSKEV